jgi:hypothetical protein
MNLEQVMKVDSKYRLYCNAIKSALFSTPPKSTLLPTELKGWHLARLIQNYTACHLAFQKDKLIALSGLLSRIAETRNPASHAGIFTDCLHQSLLWVCREEPLELLPNSTAPLWSWAAYKGPIQHVTLRDDWAGHHFIPNEEVKLVVENNPSSIQPPISLKTPLALVVPELETIYLYAEGLDDLHSLFRPQPELSYLSRDLTLFIKRSGRKDTVGWVAWDRAENHMDANGFSFIGCVVIATLKWTT